SPGTGNGELQYPQGIGVNLTGDVWVADTFNSRIQRFSPSGAFLQSIGSHGIGNGQFIEPVDVAVDSWGNIWVVDITTAVGEQFDRIQEFNSAGVYIRSISGLYGIF